VISVAIFIGTLAFVKDVRMLARYRYTWAAAGVGLILLPIVPGLGSTVNGARLWVRVGPVNFQPGEFGKICLVLFFAGRRSPGVLRVGRYAVGVVDLPLVFLAMDRGIPFYPERGTVAGLVLERLGRIPTVGDEIELPGWRLTVTRMDRRRVAELRLTRIVLVEQVTP